VDGGIAMRLSDMLSESQLHRDIIKSEDLERVLSDSNIRYVLVGAHALGEITHEPRATQDVDIIIKKEDFDRVVKLITSKFPSSKIEGTRIKDSDGNVLVDVMTDDNPICAAVLASETRIPDPETMLVMKFLSSISPLRRKDKKIQDKADFYNIMRVSDIDSEKAIEILKRADKEHMLHENDFMRWIKEGEDHDN
jgi:hypothetical protein